MEDLDLVIPVYNLLEYSSNFSDMAGTLWWFYSKDKANKFNANITENAVFKYFICKIKLVAEAEVHPASNDNNRILKNLTIAVSLKYQSNFWRSLEMPLINCKVKLKIKWTKHCVLAAAGVDSVNNNNNINIIFTIKYTKLYVPVVIIILFLLRKKQNCMLL